MLCRHGGEERMTGTAWLASWFTHAEVDGVSLDPLGDD